MILNRRSERRNSFLSNSIKLNHMVIALFAGIVTAGVIFAVYLVYTLKRMKDKSKSNDNDPFLGI